MSTVISFLMYMLNNINENMLKSGLFCFVNENLSFPLELMKINSFEVNYTTFLSTFVLS
jgi:hypothetical protein